MKRCLFIGFLICLLFGGSLLVSANEDYILPDHPNKYLKFTNANGIAVNDDYLVLFNENTIILQDIQSGTATKTTLSFTPERMQINNDGIFLQDNGINLYYKSFNEDDFIKTDLSITNFAIHKNTLLSALNKQLFLYDISNSFEEMDDFPQLTKSPDHLFFTSENTFQYCFDREIIDICSDFENVYYIDDLGLHKKGGIGEGEFLPTDTTLLQEGSFDAFTVFDGDVYLVTANKILVYNLAQNKVIYEISSNSNSDGRLNNAADIAVYENSIYIADTDNNRIVVLDTDKNYKDKLSLNSKPKKIAVYDNRLAVLTDSGLQVIDSGTGNVNSTYEQAIEQDQPFDSIAISKNYVFALWQGTDTKGAILKAYGETSFTFDFDKTKQPIEVATDISGNIYILFNDGIISKFEIVDNEFKIVDNVFKTILLEGANVNKFIIDIDLIPAVLTDSGVLIYNGQETILEGAVSLSYYYSESCPYILYGDRIIQNTAVNFATIEIIDEEEFEIPDSLALVKLLKNKVFFEFDINKAYGERTYHLNELNEDMVVIVLLKTDRHIIFTGGSKSTDGISGIALISNFVSIASSDYYLEEFESAQSGIATIDFYAYKLPALKIILQDTDHQFLKDQSLNLISKITHPDFDADFYILENQGKILYIPESFMALNVPSQTNTATNYTSATLKQGKVKIYQNADDTADYLEIDGGQKIYIISQDGSFAQVFINDQIQGYIKISDLSKKGSDVIRNTLALIIIMVAASATTLYLIAKKNKNQSPY